MTASNGIGTEAQIGLLRCGVFPGRRDLDWLVFSCSWLGQWSWSGEEMDLTSWPSSISFTGASGLDVRDRGHGST